MKLATLGALVLIRLASPSSVHAQAATEAGLGAARAATTAAPARNAGNAMAGAWSALENAIKPAPSATTSTRSRTASSRRSPVSTAAVKVPAPVYEDPSHIEAGLAYADLIHRFGPPNIEMTNSTGQKSGQYVNKTSIVSVDLAENKVSKVTVAKFEQSMLVLGQ